MQDFLQPAIGQARHLTPTPQTEHCSSAIPREISRTLQSSPRTVLQRLSRGQPRHLRKRSQGIRNLDRLRQTMYLSARKSDRRDEIHDIGTPDHEDRRRTQRCQRETGYPGHHTAKRQGVSRFSESFNRPAQGGNTTTQK